MGDDCPFPADVSVPSLPPPPFKSPGCFQKAEMGDGGTRPQSSLLQPHCEFLPLSTLSRAGGGAGLKLPKLNDPTSSWLALASASPFHPSLFEEGVESKHLGALPRCAGARSQ